ncbi:hypothetical protein FDECE_6248, partial [Fusarium decemcellulare]
MSDAGDSTHKRSKSAAALSLLRRKDTREEESGSEDGRAPRTPSSSNPVISMARQPSVRGHAPKSVSSSGLSPVNSAHHPPKSAPALSPPHEKSTASLEQSVRKFRVVEALRSGDTASLSRAIR